jgi:hypothetical protein
MIIFVTTKLELTIWLKKIHSLKPWGGALPNTLRKNRELTIYIITHLKIEWFKIQTKVS